MSENQIDPKAITPEEDEAFALLQGTTVTRPTDNQLNDTAGQVEVIVYNPWRQLGPKSISNKPSSIS